MLVALKRELKDLIGQGRPEEVIRKMKEEVVSDSVRLYNDIILIQSRMEDLARDSSLGTISFDDSNLTFNSVNEALIWAIGDIQLADLREDLRRKQGTFKNIPAYHAYAVDRVKQTEKFELDRYLPEDPDQKIHFYYLYGDLRQEMQSLVNRLSQERSGRTLSLDGMANASPGKDPLIVACKPEPRGNKQLFRILLLKSLLEKFVGPVNNMRDLQQKTLKDLLASPKLTDFGRDDAVCILVTLDDYNWRKEVVPPVLQDLYQTFCNCDLPPEAPHFYFFFGVEYKKENLKIKEEVAAAIANRQYGEVFDELLPVGLNDVAEWLTRHRLLIPRGKEADEVAAELFPGKTSLDMLDVETELKAIIDRHNKGLVLNNS